MSFNPLIPPRPSIPVYKVPTIPLPNLSGSGIGSNFKLTAGISEIQQSTSVGDITKTKTGQAILDLAKFDWGSKYLYMVHVDKLNLSNFISSSSSSKFAGNVVPAYAVLEKIPEIRTENIKLPVFGNFRIPVGRSLPTVQISLYDTEDCVVEKAIRLWCNQIAGNQPNTVGTVNYLNNITSDIMVFKLYRSRQISLVMKYKGYPDGDINVAMSSDSGLKELAVNFIITECTGGTAYPSG